MLWRRTAVPNPRNCWGARLPIANSSVYGKSALSPSRKTHVSCIDMCSILPLEMFEWTRSQEGHISEDYSVLCGAEREGILQVIQLQQSISSICTHYETYPTWMHVLWSTTLKPRKSSRVEVQKRARIHEKGISNFSMRPDSLLGDDEHSGLVLIEHVHA